MKKNYSIAVFMLLVLASAAAGDEAEKNSGLNFNNDLLMGILWQQNSGEYAALCYQAFNAGKEYLLSLPEGGKKAVVFDIDETMLDNSMYAAWMVKTGSPWSAQSWEEWCNTMQAVEVPGALDFAQFAVKNGFTIFYITNRPASVTESTIKNLVSLGFPMADSDHVFLMENTSDKKPRIEKAESAGFEIVLFAGDNLDDFDSSIRKKNNEERVAYSGKNTAKFGTNWIMLPNPVYGTFEAAIRPDYYTLLPEEKAAARLDMIKVWQR